MKINPKDIPSFVKKVLSGQEFENIVWGFSEKHNHVVAFGKSEDYENYSSLNEFNYYVVQTNSEGDGIDDRDENCLYVEDQYFLEVQKEFLNQMFPIDWKKKKLVGVTGTNGKTSVVNFTEQLLNLNGLSCFSLGTLGVKSANKLLDQIGGMTTPGMIDLHRMLYKQYKDFDIGIIEVSSHGIALQRIYGLEFDIVAWTNFTQDHLDFHKDLEDYFQTKKHFFENYVKKGGRRCLSDSDPELIEKLKEIKHKKSEPLGEETFSKLPSNVNSGFNLKNIELAYRVVQFLTDQINELDRLRPVSGRFEVVEHGSRTFIIDYAHTPDALKNVLSSSRECFVDKEIHLLFGCGGERDREKRAQMGKIADELAEKVYLTNDNPRNEDPFFIINDIKKGIQRGGVAVIHDRRSAIRLAYKSLPENACLIIAGKGHEDYQIIGADRLYFNDLEVVKEMIEND